MVHRRTLRGLIWASLGLQLGGLVYDIFWHALHAGFEATTRVEMLEHLAARGLRLDDALVGRRRTQVAEDVLPQDVQLEIDRLAGRNNERRAGIIGRLRGQARADRPRSGCRPASSGTACRPC